MKILILIILLLIIIIVVIIIIIIVILLCVNSLMRTQSLAILEKEGIPVDIEGNYIYDEYIIHRTSYNNYIVLCYWAIPL